jgi:hypothetical protein
MGSGYGRLLPCIWHSQFGWPHAFAFTAGDRPGEIVGTV